MNKGRWRAWAGERRRAAGRLVARALKSSTLEKSDGATYS